MVRIKKSIKINTDNSDAYSKNSITKTDKKEQVSETKELAENQNTTQEILNESSFIEIAKSFINIFGEEAIISMKCNKYLQIPFTDENITNEQWLIKALKTIFTENEIDIFLNNFNNKYISLINNAKIQQAEIESLNKKLDDKIKQVIVAEKESDDFFEENKVLIKQVEKSVDLGKVIEAVFSKENQKGFLRLGKEAVEENAGEQTSNFLLAFIKEWMNLLEIENSSKKIDDESERVEIYDKLLRNFLLSIKDIDIPQRRAILDALARYVNNNFENFEFLSPEETTQIDVDIHNAKGAGGNKIKQGISFAVIRKENRKTYRYADIEAL